MKFRTVCDTKYNTDKIETIEFIQEVGNAPHWGWWVFWGILLWPVLIILAIMALTRKCYLCKIDGCHIVKLKKGVYDDVVEAMEKKKTPKVPEPKVEKPKVAYTPASVYPPIHERKEYDDSLWRR